MKTTKRFLLTLAAMIGMTGAWAQTDVTVSPVTGQTNQWTLTMPDGNVELEVEYYTQAEIDQAAADEVKTKITAIGTVEYTDASKALIDAARTAYDALTANQKNLVTNYETLTVAETAYANLKAAAEKAAADQAATDAAIAKINAIGTVEYTDASKQKIDDARTAYDALTDAQKALVSADTLKVLTDAEE